MEQIRPQASAPEYYIPGLTSGNYYRATPGLGTVSPLRFSNAQPALGKYDQGNNGGAGLMDHGYKPLRRFPIKDMEKIYVKELKKFHSADTVQALTWNPVDMAIYKTHHAINDEFDCNVIPTYLKKMPGKLSNMSHDSVDITGECRFISASSPEIDFSPRIEVIIGCQLPTKDAIVHSEMEAILKKVCPEFSVRRNQNKYFMQKEKIDEKTNKTKIAEVRIELLGLTQGDSQKPFHGARVMKAIAEAQQDKEKLTVQSLMTVVSFARLSFKVKKTKVPDVALITLGYCLVKKFELELSQIVDMMKLNNFEVVLKHDMDCDVTLRQRNYKSSFVSMEEHKVDPCYIPTRFMALIIAQYDTIKQLP
eukprot:GHVS01014034.1.p1 GENE.GHVS01014034.1~~GHVS01014034.1.p1  ORF type:complete len:364 (+),score=22.38 GHVS01014034.1:1059-2150(+)